MFDWDEANFGHILKRNLRREEVEEALQDPHRADAFAYRVADEWREGIIGMTRGGRLLHVVYTEHDGQVRPIHARNAYRHEAREYFGR